MHLSLYSDLNICISSELIGVFKSIMTSHGRREILHYADHLFLRQRFVRFRW